MVLTILLTHNWLGNYGLTPEESVVLNVAAGVGAMMLVFRSRLWAATAAAAGLVVLGTYGILVAIYWPGMPGRWYGVVALDTEGHAFFGGIIEGTVLLTLGVWLAPRVMGQHLGLREAELAARAERLTERVQTLTQTRSDAVDTAAAELRRIERDLHDGAQARLVALGMSLQAAERLFKSSPEAALALVSEAKEASSRALTELRGLVRGIYPPVLADRGLADAVKALALDTPLHTVVDIDLPGEVEMPVGSAVYFAVAEALTNAAKHSGARTIRIQLHYEHETLRAEVIDDGAGGADPEQGTGLKGVERRLATFDGILAVSSPPGGPTIVVIEVPCALSSPKISSC
ncbi:MAG: ATP-binding protein [Streptosporangiaceae bacterium]|nr:ATP-binding protein [Streptosporangiaceae bacterium]